MKIAQQSSQQLTEHEPNDDRDKMNWNKSIENSQLDDKDVTVYANSLKPMFDGQSEDKFSEFMKKNVLYVDKSLFIKHVLMHNNHLLITCPRRWGKSLNISMLEAFLQPDGENINNYDEEGKYNFKQGGEEKIKIGQKEIIKKYKKLKIYDEKIEGESFIELFQGQYPVISLNLKNVNNENYSQSEFEDMLRESLSSTFKKHAYLYKKKLIDLILLHKRMNTQFEFNENEIKKFDLKQLEYIISEKKINLTDNLIKFKAYYNGEKKKQVKLNQALTFLSDELYKYFERKTYILIDEFDQPVNSILSSGSYEKSLKQAKEVARKISQLVSPCSKGDTTTRQIILTGILNSVVQQGSSPINNLYDESVAQGNIAGFFGFDNDEIKSLLQDAFNLKENEKKKLFDKLKFWYNGQVFGQNVEVFTPSSVMKYIISLNQYRQNPQISIPQFQSFWKSTSTTQILKQFAQISRRKGFLSFFNKLVDLSFGGTFQFEGDIKKSLDEILCGNLNSERTFEELVFHYLFRSGYITQCISKPHSFKMPANEVYMEFKTQIQEYWLQDVIFNNHWEQFIQYSENIDFYSDHSIEKHIQHIVNIAKENLSALNESTFEKIIFSAFIISKNASRYKIATQPHSREGFIDIIIYFLDRIDIYELKFELKATDYNIIKILNDALRQMYDKNYMSTVAQTIQRDPKSQKTLTFRLIPMLLCKVNSEEDYQCIAGEIKEHSLEEALNLSLNKTYNYSQESIMKQNKISHDYPQNDDEVNKMSSCLLKNDKDQNEQQLNQNNQEKSSNDSKLQMKAISKQGQKRKSNQLKDSYGNSQRKKQFTESSISKSQENNQTQNK